MSDFAPTRTTYTSNQPVWARNFLACETHDVQLDDDTFLSAYPDRLVPTGTPIARSAAGRGVPAGTVDARVIGFLVNDTKVRPGGAHFESVVHAGTVTERLLPAGAATSAVKTALTAVVFI